MKNEIGNIYGRLSVTQREGISNSGCVTWLCVCDCGCSKVVSGANLRGGKVRSCGCLVVETARKLLTTHGKSRSSTYSSYRAMRKRCEVVGSTGYKSYGGRGIKVCSRWATFEGFYRDMGDKPEGTSIDRIDVNGNYEPENCRWATHKEQGNNTRTNHPVTANGKTLNIAQWAEMLNVSPTAIASRLKSGMSEDAAINTPFQEFGLTIDGEFKLIKDWAIIAGVDRNTIRERIKRMTPYQAVYAPVTLERRPSIREGDNNIFLCDLAKTLGVSVSTIKRDVAMGLTYSEIVDKRKHG